MINEKQYLEAKAIVEAYERQLQQTRVIRWHGKLNDKLKLEHKTNFLLK